MQIDTAELLNEAGIMALELRLKDRAIEALQQENQRLRDQLAAQTPEAAGQAEA